MKAPEPIDLAADIRYSRGRLRMEPTKEQRILEYLRELALVDRRDDGWQSPTAREVIRLTGGES